MTRILAINGSYRDDGITDQVIETLALAAQTSGAVVETVLLRDYPIDFCRNCRECTQKPGDSPGLCVQHDGMYNLINKIELADAYILAAPTNYSSVTAIFKRFMERLTVYAYWPWGMNAPQFRKANAPRKKAVLVSSCAAPGFLGRWVYSSARQLRMTAKVIGADTVGVLFTGTVSQQEHTDLPDKTRLQAMMLAAKLF